MKSVAAVALFALAAGVIAEDPKCEANFILDQCKATQTDRINDCTTQDWDCLCPSYEALRTCYNNCPNDPDIPSVEGQVSIFCQNASLYGSKATATATPPPSGTDTSTTTPTDTTDGDSDSDSEDSGSGDSDSGSSDGGDNEGTAVGLAGSVGAALMAAVGVVAALF